MIKKSESANLHHCRKKCRKRYGAYFIQKMTWIRITPKINCAFSEPYQKFREIYPRLFEYNTVHILTDIRARQIRNLFVEFTLHS